MDLTTLRIPGTDAIRLLHEHRTRFSATGNFPFLIGDGEELEQIREAAEFNQQDPLAIIRASEDIIIAEWIAARRTEIEEYGFSPDETLGTWPGEILEKGSIGIHRDVVSGKIKPEVYLGLAPIEQPWHLPAILKYGAWNECPHPEAHCAFHREWQNKFGAEITSMSGDTVECIVKNPPIDQTTAIILAWEQYWYCADIVEQGCGSVANLAATLINSPYWFFWWD